MTLLQFLITGQPNGTTATTGNTGASLVNPGTGGTIVWDTSVGSHGSTGLKQTTTTAGQSNVVRFAMSAASYQVQATAKITIPATTPGGEYTLLMMRNGSGKCFSIAYETTGEIRMLDSANSSPYTVASAGTLTAGTQYVFSVVATNASPYGAGNGSCTVKIYAVGSSTPIASQTFTGKNFGTATFSDINSGGTTVTGSHGIVDLQVNDGAGSEIPDYVATIPLSTPVITLGTTTNPTTVGGTNGSQVVTWSAVANATSYEAWIAPNLAPAQGDFSLVQTGVTSPYTFTGLKAGSYAFGIKAKA